MMVATDKSKSIHMAEYPTNVVQDEAMIVVDKFKHAKETQELMMHVREEKYVQVERPIIIWLDVPEIGGNQGKRYSDYFGKSRFLGGSKESMSDFECFLAMTTSCCVRRYIAYFIFIFLPTKRRIWTRCLIRDYLSLQGCGWGPPRQVNRW